MSKKIGMNVALGLNTGGFSKGLTRAKLDMDKFAKDIKRQNELAGKFGASGLGRGFGIAGGVLEGLSMGGFAGGLTGVVAGLAGMAMTVKAVMSAIDGLNKAATDARKTMQQVAEGKAQPGMVSGFTPGAAKAVTTQVQTDVFSEALASNLAPRSLEDAIKGYVVSAAPNVWRAWAAESINIMGDYLMGRQSGPVGQRMQAAAVAAASGDFGPGVAELSARSLEAIRRGQQQQTASGDFGLGAAESSARNLEAIRRGQQQQTASSHFEPGAAQLSARNLEAIRRGQQQQTEALRGN